MNLIDLLADGGVLVLLTAGVAIISVAAGLLLYSTLVYIGCRIPSVPMEHRDKNIYWRGELKHEGGDDDLSVNGFVFFGTFITWIGIAVSILLLIGYLANLFGVNPV